MVNILQPLVEILTSGFISGDDIEHIRSQHMKRHNLQAHLDLIIV